MSIILQEYLDLQMDRYVRPKTGTACGVLLVPIAFVSFTAVIPMLHYILIYMHIIMQVSASAISE